MKAKWTKCRNATWVLSIPRVAEVFARKIWRGANLGIVMEITVKIPGRRNKEFVTSFTSWKIAKDLARRMLIQQMVEQNSNFLDAVL